MSANAKGPTGRPRHSPLASNVPSTRTKLKAPQAAERLGLSYAAKGEAALKSAFGNLPEVVRQAAFKHVMTGDLDGRGLVAFEASYMVFAGQTPVQIAHTVYAVASPEWPLTHVTPRGFFSRLRLRLGRDRGLLLDDPEFNARFQVKAHDEDFAIALLGPQMQAFLLGKTTVRWRIGHGRVCLIYRGKLVPGRVEHSLSRLRGFWEHVAPELLNW